MTINGKPIAILGCCQVCAALLCYIGGIFGARLNESLHGEGAIAPWVTRICGHLALWPILFPLIWTTLVLARARKEAPLWEIFLWIILAVLFFFWVGGCGLLATFSPMIYG